MSRLRGASVPPKLPARALPRGKAAQTLYGTDHIISWQVILVYVSLFTVLTVVILFW